MQIDISNQKLENMAQKIIKDNSILKPHSMYEEALIYMSYRYAIGRKSIHSHCHACDIIKNEYERFKLNPDRMAFTSKDMNSSIENCLRFGSLNVYVENYPQKNVHILEEVIKAVIDEDGFVKYDELREIKKLYFRVENSGKVILDDIKFHSDDTKISQNIYPIFDITDLLIWYKVAKVLDMSTHKWLTAIDGSRVEYVELYDENYKDGKRSFKLYKVPVDSFVENATILTYIPDESIKSFD